ncbi:MAG: VOC family protein [Acidimicrobiales bacterium]
MAKLSRTSASEAVADAGWRYQLGTYVASVPVSSMDQALQVSQGAIAEAGSDADEHLRIDLRPDRVELSLQTRSLGCLTERDVDIAHGITEAVGRLGLRIAEPVTVSDRRPPEMLEISIDAMDIAAIRPFWRAVMGFGDEPGLGGQTDAIVDPAGQLPAIWFQQMDEPRTQRNRIHFDITVSHDEGEYRVKAALDAGGHLVNDAYARSFWVLADAEGNEVCVCTWLDRDERESAKEMK